MHCWPSGFNIPSRRALKKSRFISYLLQPQCVVLHYVFQVLQLLGRPVSIHRWRVPLHAAGAAILFILRRRSSALTPVPLRQDEGVAALTVVDAMKPPPLLCASSAAATSSFPLASSSSSSLCASDAGRIGDGWPGPKQQQHQEHPGEVQAPHDSSFYCMKVFVLSPERVKRRLLTLWPQFTLSKHLCAGYLHKSLHEAVHGVRSWRLSSLISKGLLSGQWHVLKSNTCWSHARWSRVVIYSQ